MWSTVVASNVGRAQQVHRDDAVAAVAHPALDDDVDVQRHSWPRARSRHASWPGRASGSPTSGAGATSSSTGPSVSHRKAPCSKSSSSIGIERVVVVDQHRALEERAALDVDRVGEPDDDLLVALELGVVEGLDREGQLGRAAVDERQRAAGRREVLAGHRVRALSRDSRC